MKLWATEDFNHHELHVDRNGVTIKYMRAMVGGGYYTREQQSINWPWRKGTMR